MQNRKFIPYLLLIVCIIFFYTLGTYGKHSLIKNAKFTVATVVSDFHYKNTFGGAGYDYIYFVNNVKYKGGSRGNFFKGQKYLVVYDTTNTSRHLLEFNLTDSIYTLPPNGWKLNEIPFKIDTMLIKKKLEE